MLLPLKLTYGHPLVHTLLESLAIQHNGDMKVVDQEKLMELNQQK